MNEELKPIEEKIDSAMHSINMLLKNDKISYVDYATLRDALQDKNRNLVDDNPPLTLEELRWMNGEPVYIADLSYGSLRTGWKIFDWHDDDCFFTHWKGMFRTGTYGVDWLAYRRKPEEETR